MYDRCGTELMGWKTRWQSQAMQVDAILDSASFLCIELRNTLVPYDC
jgi:hypothetical protein